MSKLPSLYVLRHIPTNTYYGTRRRSIRSTYDVLPKSYSDVHIRPLYNIVGFKKFKDALMVVDSIATHRSVYYENPKDRTICIYNDNHFLVDGIEHDLRVLEVKMTEIVQKTRRYNLGLRIINDIDVSDKGDINVKFKELSLDDDNRTNFDFIDSLESNLYI